MNEESIRVKRLYGRLNQNCFISLLHFFFFFGLLNHFQGNQFPFEMPYVSQKKRNKYYET